MTRASVLTAVLAGSAVCAGPLVGVALAQPTLQSSSPTDGSLITSASAVPTKVSATYDKALYSPTSPVFPSTIRVARAGAETFDCTPALSSDMKTLSCTPATGVKFVDGTYTVTITASPAPTTGDTTAAHDSFSFTIDTTPPQIDVQSPQPNSRVQPPGTVVATYEENLAGTPATASTITVVDSLGNTLDGASVVTNPTSTSGVVTWTPAGALPEGDYVATSAVTDVHGLTSSTSWPFTVDTKPPAPPVVTAPTWVNIANQHHVPIGGTAVNDTGGASTVQVSVSDGTTTLVLDPVVVGNDGTWSAASVADLSSLSDHALTVKAVAIDEAGNVSDDSATVASTKDAVAPAVPTVTFPDASKDSNNNPVVNASNSTLHVSGITEPGAGVSVTATDGPHTTTPATTAADDQGAYNVVVDTASLDQGTLTVAAVATDAAGNAASGSYTITKDSVAPGTPTITTFDDVNQANDNSSHTVAGTASTDPGTTLSVWLTDSDGFTTTPQAAPIDGTTGAWSIQLPVDGLAEGPITAHAQSTDADNNLSAEATKVATKDTNVPAPPVYTPPQWINVASESAVPLSGTAEPFSTVHLVATDTGTGSKTVDVPVAADGSWSTTLDLHTFADGAIDYVATVHDAVDNASDPQGGTSTMDTVAPATPAAPTLSSFDPNTGLVTATGSSADGDTLLATLTSDGGAGQATGSGTAASGIYSAPVDASGLADGTLTGVVVETDPAGNSSSPSPSSTTVKDTISPLVAQSTSPSDGDSVRTTPTLSATYNEQLNLAQSTVTLKDSVGGVLGHTAPSLSADKKTISFSPANDPLAEGSGYQAIFAVKDLSTNDSTTTTVHFVIDRTSPAAPTVASVADIAAANVSSVPVSGTAAEPGGTVHVTVTDGTHNATATAPVADDSTWSVPVDADALDDGPVTATATQTDAAGNESAPSAGAAGAKDTVAPAMPSFTWSSDVTHAISNVTFSGTAEPSSTVSLVVDDGDEQTLAASGTTTAGADGTWSKQLDLAGQPDGALTATAWATDGFGNVGLGRAVAGRKDTVVPSARMLRPTTSFVLSSVRLSWAGSDAGSALPAHAFDVRWARAPHGRALGGYGRLLTAVSATSVDRALAAGVTGCYEVRAHDAVGNTSPWSPARCTTAVLDDKWLTASSGWTRVSSTKLFHGSALRATRKGVTLRLGSSRLHRIAIVATHCSACGSIVVYVGSHRVGAINLHSSTLKRRVLTTLAGFSLRTRVVTIKVTSSGKRVEIDGVGTTAH
jgi:hypothetical protein